MKDFTIRLSMEFIIGASNEALIIYPYIQMLYLTNCFDSVPISAESMAMLIYGESYSRRDREQINIGINELVNTGIISASKKDSIYNVTSCAVPNKSFAAISLIDISSIMKSEEHKKAQLLRYYCLLMHSRSQKLYGGKISTQKISYFATCLEMSERTILRYNDILSELKVIYIGKFIGYKTDDGYAKSPNVYSRYADRYELLEYIDSIHSKKYRPLIKKYQKLPGDDQQYVTEYIKAHNSLQLYYSDNIPGYVPDLLDEFKR